MTLLKQWPSRVWPPGLGSASQSGPESSIFRRCSCQLSLVAIVIFRYVGCGDNVRRILSYEAPSKYIIIV